MAKPYNGFPSWAQWNVSLWLNNDEGLYGLMTACKARRKPIAAAARLLQAELQAYGMTRTPDGARYSLVAIRGAMAE